MTIKTKVDLTERRMDPNLANAFELRLVGPPAGALRAASQDSGVGYIAEGFVDRAYTADGGLLPRDQAGAVFDREDRAVRQALSIAGHQRVTTHDGNEITLSVDTLCLHGDTPGAVDMARAVRSALLEGGIQVQACLP